MAVSFELDEVTVAQLREGIKSGKYTARSFAEKYLARIEEIDRNGPSLTTCRMVFAEHRNRRSRTERIAS